MKIGILASGGDGAGMNCFLFNIYKYLSKKNEAVLFNKGFWGLINNQTLNFSLSHLKEHKNDGGIIIKTSRCKEFASKEGMKKALETLKVLNIDLLIVMGGNGSLRGATELVENGVNVIFIPCTIDNDIAGSEYCIGFDTACYNCTNFIMHVNDTMKSFNRTCIYEAMGRECPEIAIVVGNNVNADYLYVSNVCSVEGCIEAVKKSLQYKDAPIVILRENLIDIQQLKQKLIDALNIDVKTCIVGYVQRGGKPTSFEKKCAKNFAKECFRTIKNKQNNCAIVVKNGKFCGLPIKKI